MQPHVTAVTFGLRKSENSAKSSSFFSGFIKPYDAIMLNGCWQLAESIQESN